MREHKQFWFPAKRYGWGWGLPVKWQGWLALLAYVVVMAIGVNRWPPSEDMPAFVTVVLAASVAFVLVCWWKGEPPRWRWGDDPHG